MKDMHLPKHLLNARNTSNCYIELETNYILDDILVKTVYVFIFNVQHTLLLCKSNFYSYFSYVTSPIKTSHIFEYLLCGLMKTLLLMFVYIR